MKNVKFVEIQRRDDVLARRAAVHVATEKRRGQLDASLQYQNLRRDIQELSQWIAEKQKIANDDSYKDTASVAMKLLKHKAFEAELKANAARLDELNSVNLNLMLLFSKCQNHLKSHLETYNEMLHFRNKNCNYFSST